MRSLSIQVQPARSPGIDMPAIQAMFAAIATEKGLVEHHAFNHGVDDGPYFNFTFGTLDARTLWQRIRRDLYEDPGAGPHMRRASMAVCSEETGWDDYDLLYHFDPAVPVDTDPDF